MKFLLKIILGFIIVVVAIITMIFMQTKGMPDAADEFLNAVKLSNTDNANSFLSQHIKDNPVNLYLYLKNNSFDKVKGTSWSSRAFVNNNGNISGVVTISNGANINTRMTFIKEDGSWKIYSIQKLTTKDLTKAEEPKLTIQKKLVKNAMATFLLSAREKSMSRFYQGLSGIWKNQVTIQKLDDIFGSIYKFKGDLRFLDNVDPVIESHSISKDGILIVAGMFPTNQVTIYFTQKYIYEGVQWKLFGFDYSNKKPSIQ